MWSIIIFLLAGIFLGSRFALGDKGKRINARLQQAGLLLLLFSMGISIGANEEVIGNLNTIGLQAFLFAALTTAGSVFFVYLVSRRLSSKEV